MRNEAFSLPDLLVKYLNFLDFNKKLSPHTLRAYSHDLLQLFQIKHECTLDGPKINSMSEYNIEWQKDSEFYLNRSLTLETWQSKLRGGLKTLNKLESRSKKRRLSALTGFNHWLKSEGHPNFEIPTDVRIKKISKIPHFLSVDECLTLIQHLKNQPSEDRNKKTQLLFYLLYGCGLRISEASQLRWDQIHIEKKLLRLVGKRQKERLVVIPQGVLIVLKQQLRSGEWVWGNSPLHTRTAYELIRQLGLKAQLIRPLHPHSLRHSYATHLLSSGADLRVLQQLLGHESLSATEVYTHIHHDQLARTLEAHHPLSQINKKNCT